VYVRRTAMNTKLTLRMDEAAIRGAKAYAARTGTSVSQLAEEFFTVLASELPTETGQLTGRVQDIYGALADTGVSEADYAVYLEEKYR
jgi:16S rRNA C1402 N4-methylase RsmH